MSDDKNLQELREETESGDRITEEAAKGSFEERVKTQLDAVDAGDKSDTVSSYDIPMAALLHALDETDGALEDVVGDLQAALGKDVDADNASRSDVLKLAVRFALKEQAPERYEAGKSAYSDWKADDF